ncbi:PIN domain-containing protein [Rodentibacter trehalosifermentans]|nr:PIN domain-containing protein [Rodentibacter trehalosifermentans]
MKKILLDTNKIINILKGNPNDIEWFKQQYKFGDVIFFTTPLIRHEVLRFYDYSKESKAEYEKAEKFLSGLEIINIDKAITDIATNIFRHEKEKHSKRYQPKSDGTEKRLDKYNFDTMYVATAKCFKLDISSNDGDIPNILSLYDEMMSSEV